MNLYESVVKNISLHESESSLSNKLTESLSPNESEITKDLTDYINSLMDNKAESIVKAEVTEDHIGVYVSVNNKILYQEIINLDKVKSFINSEM